MKIRKKISIIILSLIMVLSGAAGVFVAYADEDDSGKEYYLAFSHQN